MARLTEREKAVLRYAVAYGEKSPSVLYRLAYPGREEDAPKPSAIAATASRWYHSDRVAMFMRDERAALDARLELIRQNAVNEYKTKTALTLEEETGLPDYTLPANQVREINRIINASTDAKDKLDALKLLIAQQKNDGEAAQTQQVQRFYTPLSCHRCPLYEMAGEVLRLRASQKYEANAPETKAGTDAKLRAGGRAIVEKYVQKLIKK